MGIINSFANWYFSKKALPYWTILLLDCLIVIFAVILVVTVTEGTISVISRLKDISIAMGAYLICYMVGFRCMHTYSGVLRYSTFVDLQRIAFANLIGMFLSLFMRHILDRKSVV